MVYNLGAEARSLLAVLPGHSDSRLWQHPRSSSEQKVTPLSHTQVRNVTHIRTTSKMLGRTCTQGTQGPAPLRMAESANLGYLCATPIPHYFPAKARGHKNIRASHALPRDQDLFVFMLLSSQR